MNNGLFVEHIYIARMLVCIIGLQALKYGSYLLIIKPVEIYFISQSLSVTVGYKSSGLDAPQIPKTLISNSNP